MGLFFSKISSKRAKYVIHFLFSQRRALICKKKEWKRFTVTLLHKYFLPTEELSVWEEFFTLFSMSPRHTLKKERKKKTSLTTEKENNAVTSKQEIKTSLKDLENKYAFFYLAVQKKLVPFHQNKNRVYDPRQSSIICLCLSIFVEKAKSLATSLFHN